MADQFLAEIRAVPFNFAPSGWALCNGQLLPISQYTAVFSLLGVQFGGNGTSNFALPNLQGQVALGYGNGAGLTPYSVGEAAGTEGVTLDTQEIPGHTHQLVGDGNQSTTESPSGNVLATSAREVYSSTGTPTATMAQTAIGNTGSSQPHENRQPYLVLNYIIALTGIFPPRS